MAARKSSPTGLGAIMAGMDEATIERDCAGCERSTAFRPWEAEAFERKGLRPICDECAEADAAGIIAKQAREQHERFTATLRERAGIPPKWREAQLADLDADPARADAIAAAAEWARGTRRRGLLFYGEVGRGKTAIAAGAANGRISSGKAVRWLPVAELLMDLRMPFDSTEYVRAQRALDPRGSALVLDDLDKVRPSEFAREPIYVAVNAWVEADLPLLVTMNRDLDSLADDFGDRYGEPIASRLAGYCDIFEVKGRDRRLA